MQDMHYKTHPNTARTSHEIISDIEALTQELSKRDVKWSHEEVMKLIIAARQEEILHAIRREVMVLTQEKRLQANPFSMMKLQALGLKLEIESPEED